MEALAEILLAIVTFLIEVTFHAVVFIFLLVMAIFSPSYRKKLKDQWDTSNWQRVGIVLGVAMYSAALVLALFFWTPFLTRGTDDVATADPQQSITLKFSDDEIQKMKKTKEIDQLVETAGSIIKRKLAERKQEAEQAVNPNGP
jgi:thiol:disulfide interchange protein